MDDAPSDDRDKDCFAPPPEPCLCFCLHCHRQFMSDAMWYQTMTRHGKVVRGFWMCPTNNCGGAGFTFDIFPVDPDHPANSSWHSFDDDEDEEDEWDEEDSEKSDEPYDPDEPEYADDGDDDDIEGEEWKRGLEPGQEPSEAEPMAAASSEQDEEEKRYDMPDERPRTIDVSNEPDPPVIGPDDIPF